VLEQDGVLDPTGRPRTPDVVEACTDGSCAYWRYLQGTSMAAPHVSGVAALIVSRAGRADPAHGGLTMDPADVEALLLATARPVACPAPVVSYAPEGRTSAYDARCDAGPGGNGLYGAGLVDAAAAVAAIPSGSTGLPGARPLSRSSPAFASSGPSDLHH
jgi:subtilisin family serine protease